MHTPAPSVDLDLDFVRAQFPAFSHPDSRAWAHLENAGGTYAPSQVTDRLTKLFTAAKVQPYWDSAPSAAAGHAMDEARIRLPATFNANPGEVHFGPSTTQNTYVLAHAFRAGMAEGDEIVVTNQDHEANIGAWRRLAETGIAVKEWKVDPATGLLSFDDLTELITPRTRLVAVTHASNVAGTINPIAQIVGAAHSVGALVVVDGVSHAPHHAVDVRELGCDVYLYSAYKTYGPHLGMMYVAEPTLEQVVNQGHYFNDGTLNARLVPAGPDHAEIGASAGIMSYYDDVHRHHFAEAPADDVQLVRDVFELFGHHEEELMAPMLELLTDRDGVHLVGSSSSAHAEREPTLAFWSEAQTSRSIYDALIGANVACGHGHFYAHRLVQSLGLDPEDGVVRVSLVHYNTPVEVDRALEVLDAVL